MKRLAFILFICCSFFAQGQGNTTFGVRPGVGFLIAHRPVMQHLPTSHTRSIDAYAEFQTSGEKDWHHVYNIPTWGVGGYFADVGSREFLGRSATIYSYFNFPIVDNGDFEVIYRLGAGLGWVEKTFDLYENRKNIAIGSALNGTMTMGLSARKRIDKLTVGAGLQLMHYSNAAWKMPNLGINMPSFQLDIAYSLNTPLNEVIRDNDRYSEIKEKLKGEFNFDLIGTFGIKEIQPIGGPKYTALNLVSQVRYSLGPKGSITGGLDLIHNSSHIARLDGQNIPVDNTIEVLQPGINVGYMIKVNRLGILLNKGVYMYSKYKGDGVFYHRLGLRYFFDSRWIANLTLKTHFAVADYLEFGVGYTIK